MATATTAEGQQSQADPPDWGEWYADAPALRSYITQHALRPWEYFEAVCPDWAERVLAGYPDVFGADAWDWCKPMF